MKKWRKISPWFITTCIGVITGLNMDVLAAFELCVSRWNSLWDRILWLYVAASRLSHKLKSAPMWFYIKMHLLVTPGTRNVFQSLLYMKHVNNKKTIVKKTAQRNPYFAHTDQLLLGMYTNEDVTVRETQET